MKVAAYVDGACSGNPGPGGWASIILNNKNEIIKEISGFSPRTTNNQMELLAVVETIEFFEKNLKTNKECRVDIYSDSAYIVNAVKKGWLKKWSLNNYKKVDGESIQNKELWIKVNSFLKKHDINLIKVKGHDGDEFNEKADKLAKAEVLQGQGAKT